MALRKPLVINGGQIQQLQAGDTLDAIQSGGDAIVLTNNNAGAVVICAPVYPVANDAFDKAQATSGTLSKVLGLVAVSPSIAAAGTGPVQLSGVLSATTAQWDAVAGTTGGLTAGTRYYLDASTAGKITSTAPSTVGQYVVEIGMAISTTELNISIKPAILL